MLWKIASFEFKYQFRQPAFYVISFVFFLLAFGGMSSDNVTIGGGGAENFNAPFQVMMSSLVFSIFGMFIVTAFVGNIVLRDFDHKMAEIIFATRITKQAYLFGRFIGAFAVTMLAFSFVSLGLMVGSMMPWLDPERIGPFGLWNYIYALLVMVLPTMFFMATLFLSVSALTRSLMKTYAAVVGFFIFYMFSSRLLQDPEMLTIGSLLDPFGFTAFSEASRYWTVFERNELLVPLEGLYLYNRLIWIGIGFLFLGLSYRLFSFDIVGKSKKKKKKLQDEALAAPVALAARPKVTQTFGASSALKQFALRMKFEAMSIVKTVPFFVLLVLAMGNSVGGFFSMSNLYGTDLLPVTRAMVNMINSTFTWVVFIIVIYYGAELVWREKQAKIHEIVEATPMPSWVLVVSKQLALLLVVVSMFAVSVTSALIFQAVSGYTNFELGLYAERLFYLQGYNMWLVGVLCVFIQVVTNNKYFGMLVMIGYLISTMVLANLGFEHNLYHYAGRPGTPLSDMNASDHFFEIARWFDLYWGFFALVLSVLAFLMWNRGVVVGAKQRWQQIKVAAGPVSVTLLLLAIGGMTGTGSYIYYNTNVLNAYETSDDDIAFQVGYEEKFRQYEGMPQPRIIDVKTDVDIFPFQRRYDMRGTYVFENKTDQPLTEMHVVFNPDAVVHELSVEGAKIAWQDEAYDYYAFAFEAPLAVGEKRTLKFVTSMENPGFKNSGNMSTVLYNGTFFNSGEATPTLGFDPSQMLSDRNERRKRGLDPIDRMAGIDDPKQRYNSYIRQDSDWIQFETTVSTVSSQMAIAPGYLEKEWTEGDRRYFHYKMDAPIQNFFSYLSADYAVAKDKWQDVDLAVYYHGPHDFNVQRMLDASKASLDYFSKNFSPYQYRQVRILEFPAYASFAQSFPNTIPYSESIGFVADIQDDDIDYVFYVTAHELGHQWWAHQVMGANTQGGTVVVETLAQYSALMVMEKKYGPQVMRRFLKYELDRYLQDRGSEAIGELPLELVENQGYIHYRKGSVVMYALKDYLGEEAVNRALRKLIANHAYKSDPYTQSRDLIGYLREEATTDFQQQLITDLFEKIVLFDLKVTDAKTVARDDGCFDVTLTLEAAKVEADDKGKETPAELDMMIDIGAFTGDPGEAKPGDDFEIYLKKHRITADTKEITITLDKAPIYVGIDPYVKLIDRNADDNIRRVSSPDGVTVSGGGQ